MRRIDVLMAYAESDLEGQALVAAFREGLQKLGWTGEPQYSDRHSLGDGRRGVDATVCEGNRRATACRQTARGGAHDDAQMEDPLSYSTGTVFSQSHMCSRVYLQGIYKGFGELEAWLRIWNISVYVHRGTAR